MPANASIYIPHENIRLGSVFDDDRSSGSPGVVDLSIAGQLVRFNLMSKNDVQEHVNKFINYIQSLDMESDRMEDAITAIRQTKSVIGLETVLEFKECPEIWENLFKIAKHFDGYVFSYESLMLPNGGVIFGPLLNES